MNKYKRREEQTGPNVLHENVSSKQNANSQATQEKKSEYTPRHKVWPAIFAIGLAAGAYYVGSTHLLERISIQPQQVQQTQQRQMQSPPKQTEVVNHYITKVEHVYTARPAPSPQQTAQSMQYNLQNQQQNMQYNLQKRQLGLQKNQQSMQYRLQEQQMQMQAQQQAQQLALQRQQQQMQYQIQQQQMAQQRIQNWSYATQNFANAYNQFRYRY